MSAGSGINLNHNNLERRERESNRLFQRGAVLPLHTPAITRDWIAKKIADYAMTAVPIHFPLHT
jgi:hypothetical protein